LYVDRTGIYGGDVIAVTTSGGIWRINATGIATQVALLGTALSGVTTLPDAVEKYGPWSGKIVVGAKDQGLIYALDATGNLLSETDPNGNASKRMRHPDSITSDRAITIPSTAVS